MFATSALYQRHQHSAFEDVPEYYSNCRQYRKEKKTSQSLLIHHASHGVRSILVLFYAKMVIGCNGSLLVGTYNTYQTL